MTNDEASSTRTTPKFGVLDVVHLWSGLQRLGVVYETRHYRERGFRYAIGPLDPSDEDTGGIYNEADLRATTQRMTAEHFWNGPIRPREVVQIAASHPKARLRGLIGEVTAEVVSARRYTVAFVDHADKHRYRDVAARHLERRGEQLPPRPVPRPAITWRATDRADNLRPTHEFDIIDEIDQYL